MYMKGTFLFPTIPTECVMKMLKIGESFNAACIDAGYLLWINFQKMQMTIADQRRQIEVPDDV
jgi:hypothetical protein